MVVVGVGLHISNRMMNMALREAGMLIISVTSEFHQKGILPESMREPRPSADFRHLQYQIVVDGEVATRTQYAPLTPFVTGFQNTQGFEDIKIDGRPWRVFIIKNYGGNFEAQVARPLAPHYRFLYEVVVRFAFPALFLLVILGVISWWITNRLMGPLRLATAAIAAKSPQDLSPLVVDKLPSELVPLVEALNNVFDRLQHALESERRFTADAAHELRTPLAALRMKAQLLERQRPDLVSSLDTLTADINRSTMLVEQLLLMARLDPLNPADQGCLLRQRIALRPFIEKHLDQHRAQAVKRNIALKTDIPSDPEIEANPDMLAIALRNLIDNALTYIDEGCVVCVSAQVKNGALEIQVADDGPGVSTEYYAHLTDRFFRVLGTKKPGSGLGLSIVQRIAELHGGSLHFGSGLDGRGFSATLKFPP